MTTTPTHTPGPWRLMRDGPDPARPIDQPWKATHIEPPPGGLTIASPHNTEPICRVYGYLQPAAANAHLIAAAPRLKTALARLLTRVPYGVHEPPEVREAKAALAQAEGLAL